MCLFGVRYKTRPKSKVVCLVVNKTTGKNQLKIRKNDKEMIRKYNNLKIHIFLEIFKEIKIGDKRYVVIVLIVYFFDKGSDTFPRFYILYFIYFNVTWY